MFRIVLTLLAAAGCLCMLCAADEPPAATPLAAPKPATLIAKTRDGAQIEIKALDDAANPYREKYGAWDRWVYDHYDATIDPATYSGG